MPKNKGKGGKNRRRGKNENEETKRQLEFKEPGQEYSQVVRMLGNGRCECYCFDLLLGSTARTIRAFCRCQRWTSRAVSRRREERDSLIVASPSSTRTRVLPTSRRLRLRLVTSQGSPKC